MSKSTEDFAATDVHQLLLRIAERLTGRFQGVFSPETVERYVFESYTTLLRTARLHSFLPALAEHFANDRLTALAQARGVLAKPVPEVLFVCVQNAGRSQMAAALTAHLSLGRVSVRSAGSLPAAGLNDTVVRVMAEAGIDLTAGPMPAYPKPLTDDVVRAADVVITMGCGDACPVYPGKRYLNWDLADPKDRPIEEVGRHPRRDRDPRACPPRRARPRTHPVPAALRGTLCRKPKSPASCSSASTTPAARKWPQGGSRI